MAAPARNRLAQETSPYLLQHASNPVDWYPWGPEALERAHDLDRPIFLSIGYSACHWCHVMEHESFSDERIAAALNEHFVCIKVDREERPDVDQLYMKAVISLTGTGGWPLSVFLTPDRTPFYGGTYFPPYTAYGRPGFADVVAGLARGWREDRERAVSVGRKLQDELEREAQVEAAGPLDADVLDRSLEALVSDFDPMYGGFGGAPKFPRATDLRLCLRHARRLGPEDGEAAAAVALRSLERMSAGGLHDQLAGGFHRYCVDERWLVPHFEKMLYDTALLVPAYLEAHLATGRADLADVARRGCEWMLAEMRLDGGGFASSMDADSEGEEGRCYTWTPDELAELLGTERGYHAQEWFGVDDDGHLEGRSVLHRPAGPDEVAERVGVPRAELEPAMERAAASLLVARRRRPQPSLDDKVLSAWNALAISALARTHQVLGERRFLEAAQACAAFLERELTADGDLHTSWRAGERRHAAGLDEHAYLAQALVDLYESDFDPRRLRRALDLSDRIEERFLDRDRGGYFSAAQRDDLLVRLKEPHDGALPAASSVHALTLLRLAELTGRRELAARAEAALRAHGQLVGRYPAGFSQLLLAADFLAAGPAEVVVAGTPGAEDAEALLAAVRTTFRPATVVALAHDGADAELQPILADKTPGAGGAARAYPCRGYACETPLDAPEALRAWLAS